MKETMTEKEFLLKKHREMMDKHIANHSVFFANPSSAWIAPFKIADNLYYVGDRKVCIHLIDAGEGLILIDSGYPGATHLLIDSIWRAGFDPKNVRWIIHTHAHYDHFGASEEFRRLYGTKLAVSKVDAESVRQKPQRAHMLPECFPYFKIPEFDYEIEDGEVFTYGNAKIRCVLTPGHTDGVLSLFFDVTDNGKTYLAGTFGGAGVGQLTLPYLCYNERPEDRAEVMLRAIEKVWDEPVVVHLGNHPGNSQTIAKREKQLSEGGNPFIAPDSWQNFLIGLREGINNKIRENEKTEQEISEFTCN